MADGEIHYKEYTDLELREAVQTIDREQYPINFRNLEAELQARASVGDRPLSGLSLAAGETRQAEAPPNVDPEVAAFVQQLRELSPRTPVTHALIAINVLVFGAMALAGAGVVD